MVSKRRRARILALQILFELDTVGHPVEQTIASHLADSQPPMNSEEFMRELVQGVLEHRDRIDAVIRKNAPAWPLEQVAAIDRNILRLAIYEIVIDNKVPMRAAINEAVDLAKDFGGETSPKFINGVLGSVSLSATR